MKQSELNNILKLHKKWIDGEKSGVRADLSYADLSYNDLSEVNLGGSDLSYADLSHTILCDANLSDADLSEADLSHAELSDADLRAANLSNVDLSYADLYNADLRDANLSHVDLSEADLHYTDLRGTDLNWVNWHEACGIKVYIVGLQSSRENTQLAYIPSLDTATMGCFQSTWDNLKKKVKEVYKKDNPKIYQKYQVAISCIEEQVKLDKGVPEDE